MTAITRTQLLKLAPHANTAYLAAFDLAPVVLPRYGLISALRISHFAAQCMHESGGLTILRESLKYTHAERLMAVWPTRFKTFSDAAAYVYDADTNPHADEALANKVYANRLGNVNPGDGFRYIGRGLLQITGRANYRRYGKLIGIDLEANPDLAVDPRYALEIAAAEWRMSGCNQLADSDDIKAVTKAINGGFVGLNERREWLRKVKAELG